MSSLPSDQTTAARRRRGRVLSRKRVKQLVRIDQAWEHVQTGRVWQVRQIHRGDGAVELAYGGERRRPTFGELGRQYQLVEDEG